MNSQIINSNSFFSFLKDLEKLVILADLIKIN